MKAKYDEIGRSYNSTRKADRYLMERIFQNLSPKAEDLYLDIGCGTGNYTVEFQKKGYQFIGVDPSNEMLSKARQRNRKVDWRLGQAEKTGLKDASIDGIVASLTIHHWRDLTAAFAELSRILRTLGKIVIFTSSPQQMKGYWLNYYFPKMLQDSIRLMPSVETVSLAMEAAGLEIVETQKYFVRPDIEDLFLYSGKHNPEVYFKKEVRNGMSTFSALANRYEVKEGLEKLKKDVISGEIEDVKDSYDNELGDYLFIMGEKITG